MMRAAMWGQSSGRVLGDQWSLTSDEDLKDGIWPRAVVLWLTAGYMALFIIRPWEQLFPYLGVIHFERLYAIVMIAAVFLSRRTRLNMGFQSISVLIFLGALGIASFAARHPSLAWEPLYEYATIVMFFFVLLSVVRSSYELVFLVIAYIGTMTMYLGKSLWEYFVHGQHRYDQGVVRLVGIEDTFGGPNNLAMSIVASLPFLLFLWKFRTDISRDWPDFWQRWFIRGLKLYAVIAITSIVLTNSRSGMLGLVIFVIFAVPQMGFSGKKHLGKIFLGVLGGAVILTLIWFLMPKENQDRFRSIWDPDYAPTSAQASAEGRESGFWAGMEMFRHFPVTGVGLGNFIDYRLSQGDGVPLNAHNLAGQVLGETGSLGGAAFLVMLTPVFLNARKLRQLARKRTNRTIHMLSALGGAIQGSLWLLLFEGLFGHNLLRFNWLWLAAFAVLAVELSRRRGRSQGVARNQPAFAIG